MWPRFTNFQKQVLLSMEMQPRALNRLRMDTQMKLVTTGMMSTQILFHCWGTLTQRGQDYVRFGMRRTHG